MYIVRWCDHEGNQWECECASLDDARLEAADLDEQYDGVEIVKADCTMPREQLCKISHYLWILDTYLFVSKHPKREQQMEELGELQHAITAALHESV